MSSSPLPANLKTPFAASAICGHLDTRTAATEIADALFDELGTPTSSGGLCDLVLLFGSFHHRSAFDDASSIIRRTLSPHVFLGVTAEAVLGAEQELDGVAGMSAIALRLPGVTLRPWLITPEDPMPLNDPAGIRKRIGVSPTFRSAIMFGDPWSVPITRLLPALSNCGEPSATNPKIKQRIPIIGGMASGASQPGVNVLVLNERVISSGAIGVSLSGDLDVDFVLSQGCRPIARPLIVTKCKDNVILELGGRKAIEMLQEIAQHLPEAEKRLLVRGLLIGSVVNEYKDHFGRGDFLVRSVMGLDQRAGGIVVGEMPRVGQTVQFHVRDAATAHEDLQLLLDAQILNPVPPFAAMLFTCNGRGERLFGEPNHDLNIIHRRLGPVPIAGFFAAGEFGPLGDQSYLHGHTASLALLRARSE